jgi:hypothetical protein
MIGSIWLRTTGVKDYSVPFLVIMTEYRFTFEYEFVVDEFPKRSACAHDRMAENHSSILSSMLRDWIMLGMSFSHVFLMASWMPDVQAWSSFWPNPSRRQWSV